MTIYVIRKTGKPYGIDNVTSIEDNHSIIWQDGEGFSHEGVIWSSTSGIPQGGIPTSGIATTIGQKVVTEMTDIPADVGTNSMVSLPDSVLKHPRRLNTIPRSIIEFGVSTFTPLDKSGVCTITIATPAVITFAASGFQENQPVIFTTDGALPTGITAGQRYYIKTMVTADTFQISATVGGAAINTSGGQSGTHTVTKPGLKIFAFADEVALLCTSLPSAL